MIFLNVSSFTKLLVLCLVLQLWNTHHSPGIVVDTCKQSLSNLGLDYVDLYLIHWPFGFQVKFAL
jgi:diketogulonate reductase-like aldo/keto reductase